MVQKRRPVNARQSILSFSSKVSKPVHTTNLKDSKSVSKASRSSSAIKSGPASTASNTISRSVLSLQGSAITNAPLASPVVTSAEDEEQATARKITQQGLKAYYTKSVLGCRIAAPVHQKELSLEEMILRHFDLSSLYGPCIGITRLNRWKRAQVLGFSPPIEVLALALKMEDERGGNEKIRDTRRSYLDDFLSTRKINE